ncbi:CotH kinase family protein [Mucilaginibacter sp. dw_454]|uniref:CotH kinase family protein n=1 Tax=Mucilaginibacter sp. dw_454 TaxID=2720079 RepID=UPI001BD69D07|nr:CotH kinase family protein [Mucilaginibacter sp. dw_454]
MKIFYLLYLPVIVLLVSACKKNAVDENKQSTTLNNGSGGKTSPTSPTSAPRLINLKINGASCAYDSLSVSYYYPVAVGTTLTGYTISFDTTTTAAVFINKVRIKNGGIVNTPLATNTKLTLTAVNNKITATYNLIATGMPVVMLTAGAQIGDDDINATLDVIDPDYQSQHSKIETVSKINISLRGETSRYYPKSSFAIHTVDNANNATDVSFLGLRDDNDWILDAMYIDQSRMRNRLCTDIWNSFNNVPYIASEPTALNGTRGYMSEVFLNGKYNGIYCLTEKLDRKQLQIKKQYGDMYKAKDWTDETDLQAVAPFDNNSDTWEGWELEYPDLGDSPAPDWTYLYNEINFIGTSSDADFIKQISAKVDLNNVVDYFIFMNILEAWDNQNKNTYFSFYDIRTAPAFFYSPWDLDGTMGGDAAGGHETNALVEAGNNYLYQRLLKLNPNNFKDLLKQRWNSLKSSQLSKSVVAARIETYRSLLVNTNAFARERLVWNNITQDLNPEASYMTTWYSAQYDLFDTYVNNL